MKQTPVSFLDDELINEQLSLVALMYAYSPGTALSNIMLENIVLMWSVENVRTAMKRVTDKDIMDSINDIDEDIGLINPLGPDELVASLASLNKKIKEKKDDELIGIDTLTLGVRMSKEFKEQEDARAERPGI
jgi:hypothetical protein